MLKTRGLRPAQNISSKCASWVEEIGLVDPRTTLVGLLFHQSFFFTPESKLPKSCRSPQQFYNFVEIPQQHDSTSIRQNELRSTTIRHLTWSAEMVAGLSTASGSDTAWTAVPAYSDSPSHSQVETSSNTRQTDTSKADSRTAPLPNRDWDPKFSRTLNTPWSIDSQKNQ